MPRGIPNVKRDETGMRYTSFNVPLAPNPKHMSATYLKSETQTRWARNAIAKSKATVEDATSLDRRRGSQVLVIHPGSRFIRIGKASDTNPVTVPNVVARKTIETQRPSSQTFVEHISRPRKGMQRVPAGRSADNFSSPSLPEDPFDAKIAAISISLRERMRFYKLRVTPNANSIASTFNESFKPDIIADHNDPYRVDWIESSTEDVYIGEQALRIADPDLSGYAVRRPIDGTNFNMRDYPSLQLVLSDIETIIRLTLSNKFNIAKHEYKNYSVVLVIPDFYDRVYVRELCQIILVDMGFKQMCAQQESLAATYGAGISNACVVDIGATKTSIACVDEGLVLSDTRMSLNMGGDDITEFLYVLLERINFPYRDLNLAHSYDWGIMEDLKTKLCTLAEGDVALNLYDFVVRRPDRPAEKYGLRAYDEIILAPMCIFEPRVIEFDRKRVGLRVISHSDITEDIIEHQSDRVTNAMMISTQHLMPTGASDQHVTPKELIHAAQEQEQRSTHSTEDSIGPSADTPDIMVDVVEADNKPATQPGAKSNNNTVVETPQQGSHSIDICFEASKLPLDVAIFNSARAAGGDDKIRKYLQAVLVIGGTALIPGMAHALESRLQAIATPLVPNMEKVQIVAPPKDVDLRVLAWKGAAVLGKMDGVSELWVTASDWDIFGMRALKERCFYL